ncbi:hypothetical protein [Photobacterium sanguinicancri]|uniref:hypothetical protein n=1 Tax=Photobacterium sanguinicancri TaxID=875932 RepID=UPI0026E1DB74|nr:hypothetical protein [Photobacterium sanguinicancri]MDO6496850.1 hypothetical protein [Photobacterium sanguinicancri]
MSKLDFTSLKVLFKKSYSSARAADTGKAYSARSHLNVSIFNLYTGSALGVSPELLIKRLFQANHAASTVLVDKSRPNFQHSKRLRDAFAKRAIGGEL